MDFEFDHDLHAIEQAIDQICAQFDDDYWLRAERDHRFPQELVDELVRGGWMGVTISEEFGGGGLGITEAAVMIRRIGRMGGNASSAVHINLFGPHPVVVFGTHEQKSRFLPPLIDGRDRACFAVTEPNVGLDTTHIRTFATRHDDHYVVTGHKVWTSNAQTANKILLVTRTSKYDAARPTDGITLFYTDFDRDKITVHEISKMGRNAVDSNELFIDGLEIPVADRIGDEGNGFRYLLHGINAERILLAASFVGAGQAVLEKASAYARERVVFGRPIGMNQAIQHPLADCWMRLEAADAMVWKAATRYDSGEPCGLDANTAKYLAGSAYFDSAIRAVRTLGGYGYATEYHVERYYREAIMSLIAPVSHELILCHVAERALSLPKSY
jgi:acyl-CoA dehydrogenase